VVEVDIMGNGVGVGSGGSEGIGANVGNGVNFGIGVSETSVTSILSETPKAFVNAEGDAICISSGWVVEEDCKLRRKSFLTRVAHTPNKIRVIVRTIETKISIL
jgi:hypothetical protein